MNKTYLAIFLLLVTTASLSQETAIDSLRKRSPSFTQFILPAAFVGYGIVALSDNGLQRLDKKINESLVPESGNILAHSDYMQYSPALSVYALNLLNIKGRNNFKDRTILLGASTILTGATVTILKKQRIVIRPNGKNAFSFPSGHTAIAFMGAEFLHQEYKDRSVWYGIAGYTVAAVTGGIRIYNNAHWLSDIVAGAGIGILSTKLMYYLYPHIKKMFVTSRESLDISVIPSLSKNNYGLSIAIKV